MPVKHRHPEDGLRLSAAAHGSPPDPLTDLSVRGFFIFYLQTYREQYMLIETKEAKKRLTDALRPHHQMQTQEDDERRIRHVWQQCHQGRDWLILSAQQGGHFDFRENILQGIKRNRNPAYAILLGSRAENWYVFKTDLMPLIELILERQERRMPQKDGSIYFEVDYEISTSSEMCLTAYRKIELVEMPDLSELVNRA